MAENRCRGIKRWHERCPTRESFLNMVLVKCRSRVGKGVQNTNGTEFSSEEQYVEGIHRLNKTF